MSKKVTHIADRQPQLVIESEGRIHVVPIKFLRGVVSGKFDVDRTLMKAITKALLERIDGDDPNRRDPAT
jgi:hypothetical protein